MSGRVGRSVQQRRLASELKRLRELALLTGDEVAERLGWSPSKISRMENARIRLKADDVRRLLQIYGVVGDQATELLGLLNEEPVRNWWDAYEGLLPPELLTLISFEAQATRIRNFEPMVVPGLLQTKEYAREVTRMWQQTLVTMAPIEAERRIDVRMTRQRVLTRDRPIELSAVMDEAVLLRQVGDRTVMREQLLHLRHVSQLSNVTLQVLELGGRQVTAVEPFVLLDIPDFNSVLCIEDFFGSRLRIDDTQLSHRYKLMFDRLQQSALSPEESRELITSVTNEHWIG